MAKRNEIRHWHDCFFPERGRKRPTDSPLKLSSQPDYNRVLQPRDKLTDKTWETIKRFARAILVKINITICLYFSRQAQKRELYGTCYMVNNV